MNNELLKQWQGIIPLLCEKWPERFKQYGGDERLWFLEDVEIGVWAAMDRITLDPLSAVAEAVGGVTDAFNDLDLDGYLWSATYRIGHIRRPVRDIAARHARFPDEISARLAATIALVRAKVEEGKK